MSGIIAAAKQIYDDFVTGRCHENFDKLDFDGKLTVALKSMAVAFAAGIIACAFQSVVIIFVAIAATTAIAMNYFSHQQIRNNLLDNLLNNYI